MKFKDYQIRPYRGFNDIVANKYELVKWTVDNEGASYCFVIAFIEWNKKEPCWEFRSVGTRYLEHSINGLNEWVLKYLDALELTINEQNELGDI